MYSIIIGMLLATAPVHAAAAPDRCVAVRNCLCKVAPGPRPGPSVETKITQRRFSVYFGEDEDSLSADQQAALEQFFLQFKGDSKKKVSVVGYADGCGTDEYNKSLSGRRGQAVSTVVHSSMYGAQVTRIVGGERSAGHLPESRRVDIVVHTKKRITTLIDKVPADFYLIDASGSMWDGYRDWSDVVNASVKPGSQVYLSIMTGCRNGQSIASITPQGGTEIWWSYWVVLDKMRAGQTLVIISDLDSNVPLSRRESAMLTEKATAKGVNVKYIRP